MHTPSGNWKRGLLLSLTTAVFWGMLPIGLSGMLQYTDSVTITWFRFLFASILLGGYLLVQQRMPKIADFNRQMLWMISIVTLGLLGNYILFMFGLQFSSPEGAQIMIQLSHVLLLLGGLAIYKESFSRWQWFGVCCFLSGIILFFNTRYAEFINADSSYAFGIVLIIFSSILWAAYALAQKTMLKKFSSDQIMIIIYLMGVLVFLPTSKPTIIFELDKTGWLLLLFCGTNTLIAYGAFAEALEHLEASKISAILAITPLFTLVFIRLTNYFFPSFIHPEPINTFSLVGAGLVVSGSAIVAMAKKIN